jgi:hypothetical protein
VVAWPRKVATPARKATAVPDAARGASRRQTFDRRVPEVRARSPSSHLTPAMFAGDQRREKKKDGERRPPPAPVCTQLNLRAALLLEAAAHLRCVLLQYSGHAERQARCTHELGLLSQYVADELDVTPTPHELQHDPETFNKFAKLVLASPILSQQLAAFTDAFEEYAGRWIDLRPGQLPDATHDPVVLNAMFAANPVAALLVRKLWQLNEVSPDRPARLFCSTGASRDTALERETLA